MIIPATSSSVRITPVSGVTNVNTSGYSQSSSNQSGYSQQSASLSFSTGGLRMSNIMSRARGMDSEELKSSIRELKEKFEALDLDAVDTSGMTREELEEKALEIQKSVNELTTEVLGQDLDTENMTDEDLADLIDTYSERIDELQQGFTQLESMVGVVTMGGIMSTSTMSARSLIPRTYQSMQDAAVETSDQVSTPELLENLLQAWEDGGEEEHMYQTVYDYLCQGLGSKTA